MAAQFAVESGVYWFGWRGSMGATVHGDGQPALPGVGKALTARCVKCREAKPLAAFNRDLGKLNGRSSWCKDCRRDRLRVQKQMDPERFRAYEKKRANPVENAKRRAQQRIYRQKDPERFKEYQRKWKADPKNKGMVQVYHRKKLYNLTDEQFRALLAKQSGDCAICGDAMTRIHVDHCHASGKIRALLCTRCNTGLGQFKDDIGRLTAAIEYLRAHDTGKA